MRKTFPLKISSVERKAQSFLRSVCMLKRPLKTAFHSKMETAQREFRLNVSPVLLQRSNETLQLCKKSRFTLFQRSGFRENTPAGFQGS